MCCITFSYNTEYSYNTDKTTEYYLRLKPISQESFSFQYSPLYNACVSEHTVANEVTLLKSMFTVSHYLEVMGAVKCTSEFLAARDKRSVF